MKPLVKIGKDGKKRHRLMPSGYSACEELSPNQYRYVAGGRESVHTPLGKGVTTCEHCVYYLDKAGVS